MLPDSSSKKNLQAVCTALQTADLSTYFTPVKKKENFLSREFE